MRSLRRSAARWPVSVLCIMAMLVPSLGGVFLPSPALAQVQTSRVAVVNFNNLSKVPDAMFTTMARDAVVVEMMRAGKFDVTPTETLQTEMEKLGYRNKDERTAKVALTTTMKRKLGQVLTVASVLDGDIISMEINRQKKIAKVQLAVRLLDVTSGELVNGAVAMGTSNPRIGFTGDQDTDWVVEAINDAAAKCVDTMVKYISPEATVIHTLSTDSVLLNKGSQDGIWPGLKMIVVRTGDTGEDELVAHIRVLTVTENDSTAHIDWQSRGVKPEDRARIVYEEPKIHAGSVKQDNRAESGQSFKKARGILLSLAGIVGLWLLSGKGGSDKGTTPGGVAVAASSPDIGAPNDVGVFIGWNDPKLLLTNNMLEFHVWRDALNGAGGSGPVISVPGSGATFPLNNNVGKFKHWAVADATSIGGVGNILGPGDPVSGQITSIVANGVTSTVGSVPGATHNYYVSTLYDFNATDKGGTSILVYGETPPVFAGTATVLSRPVQVSPGGLASLQTVDLSQIAFQWQGSMRADTYVLEVSPNINFLRSQTWCSGPLVLPTSTDGQIQMWPRVGTMDISAASELRSLPVDTPLFWRVGARCSADNPGPYPSGTVSGSFANGGAKSTRYIYTSPANTFTFLNGDRAINPPPPPTGTGGTGGGPPPPPLSTLNKTLSTVTHSSTVIRKR